MVNDSLDPNNGHLWHAPKATRTLVPCGRTYLPTQMKDELPYLLAFILILASVAVLVHALLTI